MWSLFKLNYVILLKDNLPGKYERSCIQFSTLSGILYARYVDGQVLLDLPLYPGQCCDEGEFGALVDVLSCGLPVKDVLLSPRNC